MGRLFLGGGCVVTFIGAIWLSKTTAFVFGAARATGTIIKTVRNSPGGYVTYAPVFTFTDDSGTDHTQQSSIGMSDCNLTRGEKVSVLYARDVPENAMIDSFRQVWLMPMFLTVFGLLFGGFAGVWLYVLKRATRTWNTEVTPDNVGAR